ncbi:MAG: GXWXG domain-containing protein, partial [Dermatophilaceae bacterium]
MSNRLAELEAGAGLAVGLELFDDLPPVPVNAMLGSWRGSGVPTGSPLDGLLETYGWHGKRFDGPEDAHPLVFA